jgi:hypothetical protein
MVLIFPNNTRVNLEQVSSYYYRDGVLSLHLCSGITYDSPMLQARADQVLKAIDESLDGLYYVNPPPPPKSPARKLRLPEKP